MTWCGATLTPTPSKRRGGGIIKQDKVYLKLVKDGIHIHEVEEKDLLLKYRLVCKRQRAVNILVRD